MRYLRQFISGCLVLLPAFACAAPPISPAEATQIARALIRTHTPDIDDPQVQVRVKTASDHVMRFVFSEPFPVNDETLWNIRTQYVWLDDPQEEFAVVGTQQGPQASLGPAPGEIDPSIRPETIKYLSYLNTIHYLNPRLRTVATPVTVHLVAFYRKNAEANPERLKVIGVDGDGRTFRANTFSPLVPSYGPASLWQ